MHMVYNYVIYCAFYYLICTCSIFISFHVLRLLFCIYMVYIDVICSLLIVLYAHGLLICHYPHAFFKKSEGIL